MTVSKSKLLFERAKKVIPGGVNSPVRAFNAVGGCPPFIKKAKGARIYDVDGNEYIDYVGSWGPMILGHSHPKVLEAISKTMVDGLSFGAATELEVQMAELILELVPSIEMVRMVNSGTEAVMSALRVARGYTKREKIIKFAGCYHGHADNMLVKAGSGALTNGIPNSGGVTEGAAKDTLIARYNDIDSVRILFEQNKGSIAAVIVEPVAANMGVVPPEDNFLGKLRKLCDEEGALLIFDEVITGFRLAIGGAQQYFGINADLVTYGKIIGGGMPVGAYGGRREIMECVAPVGDVYQAGTLSGNPIAMSAGIATLRELADNPEIFDNINRLGQKLSEGLNKITNNTVKAVGSLVCVFMLEEGVTDYDSAMKSDTQKFGEYFNYLLNNGIYIAPSQFEAMFISNSHTDKDIDETLEKISLFFT
ncbi:glutamate-1-semialdehyde 2,1-aminomutase [Acetivibrio mesophilus]|uniref:Glutamate-1-semialdehyde 2,1-aminomutase n=1 Tax=Acetivibrio mesophilus TaxID=2487273 RepID=A0A4Q0I1F1_9FIRM|nr:glutamate-1-semialdehyde 2,1-aminomutase [Acetivibrio mesophilus]ODM27264.1 glutamate-1-semialdehyde-2,1-aminomutase [Clostridium sp. Bc-iso-3]RXE58038.1 glutamate-1-semialdehyde-2,1-aminomutase [Acetivibrio mesophilus]HHV29801.1 glutamate-1-semialdehyde 2,1-aminomutase [Clostridium sp.]